MGIPKTWDDFKLSLQRESPGETWPEALRAMWWDAKGNWEMSHDIAQEITSDIGHWIHGYLHRKEGDRWNATYWYNSSGRDYPKKSLEEESGEIVKYILGLR